MTDMPAPLMPDLADLPDQLKDLSDRHRKFAWFYVFNGANATAAARAAGYSDHMDRCRVSGCTLIQRDDIQAAVAALCAKYLFSLAPKAVLRLEQLLDNPKHPKHDRAIDMALSRAGHGPKSTVDVNVSGSVSVSHTDQALADLRALRQLGASREKLVEVFGYSGLSRYEQMLQEREAKTIEGKAEEVRDEG